MVRGSRIAVIGMMVMAACGQPKNLVFKDVNNFRIHSIKLTEPIFAADVRFYNPNKYPIVLKHADVDVYINNKLTGKVTVDSTFTIPKKDTFSLPVMLDVSKNGAFNNALQLIMKKDLLIKLVGSARAGRGIKLVNIPINYEIRSDLAIF